MPTDQYFVLNGVVPCPRVSLFLIHNTYNDRFRFEVMSRSDHYDPDDGDEIVHFAILSDFAPYFIFLDEESQDMATDAVMKLIVSATDIAIKKAGGKVQGIPAVLKKAYAKTLHFLKRFSNGSFITEVFMKKLWRLVYRTWKHIQVYRQLPSKMSISYLPTTEYVC